MNVNQSISVSPNVYSMNFLNFVPFHQPYNHYSPDNSIGFAGTYITGCSSSAGKHCPLDKNLYPMDNSIGFLSAH